ncbi:hypothetical protein FNV43_RR15384 [Rhamnella rubrinervis]|uniref:Ubiquitin-like protease family profile domain-containing protein n=1 Tax=Rhamnella rubrinervis TaxID=2594499 RepID=A0A8K0E1Q1_9ROSA|nr:hypothetical protein FNV43_RR15384 [Rhamnella rubrinervis]
MRKYYGPPVFRVDTSQFQPTVLLSLIETVTNKGTQIASHPPSDQISDLKLQITELRSDLVAMRTELRSELRQQRNKIQNISSLVRQLVDQFAPKRAALTTFLDDQSTQFHVVEYDMMDKSSFNLILTSGGWLRDQALMHGRYVKYLKKSPNEEEDELTKDADEKKEIRDSPFDMYALGMLPVYVPVNNDNKHWLAAKVDIRSWHITLYDSDIAMSGDKFQCKNVKCLSVLFPYFLMVHGYYDHHSDLKSEGNYNLQPFSIKREDDPNLPQQTVSGDCGIYIIKYIEFMAYGPARWQGGLTIMQVRILYIFTFKISEEGPAGWQVLPAILRPSSSNLPILKVTGE